MVDAPEMFDFFFKYRVFDKERDEKTVAKKIGGCVEEGTN
jgi:hypothetical protein